VYLKCEYLYENFRRDLLGKSIPVIRRFPIVKLLSGQHVQYDIVDILHLFQHKYTSDSIIIIWHIVSDGSRMDILYVCRLRMTIWTQKRWYRHTPTLQLFRYVLNRMLLEAIFRYDIANQYAVHAKQWLSHLIEFILKIYLLSQK